jgi:hypothetical protein
VPRTQCSLFKSGCDFLRSANIYRIRAIAGIGGMPAKPRVLSAAAAGVLGFGGFSCTSGFACTLILYARYSRSFCRSCCSRAPCTWAFFCAGFVLGAPQDVPFIAAPRHRRKLRPRPPLAPQAHWTSIAPPECALPAARCLHLQRRAMDCSSSLGPFRSESHSIPCHMPILPRLNIQLFTYPPRENPPTHLPACRQERNPETDPLVCWKCRWA